MLGDILTALGGELCNLQQMCLPACLLAQTFA